MTAILKNLYIMMINDNMINEYNNTYPKTIKMKPADGKSGSCILSLV